VELHVVSIFASAKAHARVSECQLAELLVKVVTPVQRIGCLLIISKALASAYCLIACMGHVSQEQITVKTAPLNRSTRYRAGNMNAAPIGVSGASTPALAAL
jgi:hypothetical protein